MTLQEAIKSGKPFKRPGHSVYLLIFQNSIFWELPKVDNERGELFTIGRDAYLPVGLEVSAILADDWEVKP